MRRMRGFVIASFALVALLVGSSAAAAQPVRGFATYDVSVTSPLGGRSVVVNETVSQSDKTGYSDLILQLFGGQQNLTYSKLVNASENLFPYVPKVGAQSFEYSNGTAYSVHVNVTTSGTTTALFKGIQYTLNVLVVSVSASFGSKSFKTNGTVDTFPSALVYSVSVGNNMVRLRVVLQATNLPLDASSPQTAPAAYVGAGVGIGALVLGGAFLMRHRDKRAGKQGEKPLHWVD